MTLRRATIAIGTALAVLVVADAALVALDWVAIDISNLQELTYLLTVAVVGTLGVLITARRPGNAMGWLLLAVACTAAVTLTAGLVTVRGQLSGVAPHSWVEWSWWVGNAFAIAPLGLLAVMGLFFPDGRLPSRRWRPAAAVAACFVTALAVGFAFDPNASAASSRLPAVPNPLPIGVFTGAQTTGPASALWLGLVAAMLIAAASLLVRMRRSRGVARQQIKWFVYTAGVVSLIFGLAQLLGAGSGPVLAAVQTDVLAVDGFVGFGVVLPATIGLAIMKYGLYDIDVFISRTIVYGSLAAFITAVYVGIAVGFGALVGSGGRPNLGLSILATAIVAVGFQPFRQRLQHVANRLVYGRRASPYEALSQFSQRAAESYTLDDVLPRMARVLAEGTGAEQATVWLRSGAVVRPAATWPVAASLQPVELNGTANVAIPDATRTSPVLDQQTVLGALSVSKRRGETLTPIEDKLMDDLAHQAGLVMKNASLTADLRSRMEELRVSRQRIVAAQDDERRRLERNLHDGAQQHLVALKVKIGLAEMLAARDPEKARVTLHQLLSDADEALQTLRELARGIYPPLLADKGLHAALEAQARRATVPVTVEAEGLGRYPQDVEAAVYFCCLEALQNAQKYARASHVTLLLHEEAGALVFDVTDDGAGFDVTNTRRGAGLSNMSDRLDALGGSLTIESSPGSGTRVGGRVPAVAAAVS